MLAVPKEVADLIITYAPLSTKRVGQHVQVLIVGAIPPPANGPSPPPCESWAWRTPSPSKSFIAS